jgi:hypothetical protein
LSVARRTVCFEQKFDHGRGGAVSDGAAVAAALTQLRAALDRLARVDPAGLPAGQLAAVTEALHGELAGRLDGVRLRFLAAADAAGVHRAAAGSLSTTAWLVERCRLAPPHARQQVRLARRLADDLPAVAAALTAGEVGLGHVAVVHRLTRGLPPDMVAALQPPCLAAARVGEPLTLARATRHLLHQLDPDRVARDDLAAHARRTLSVAETLGGMVSVDGMLDPVSGATVLAALDAATGPPAAGDGRSPGQRRADALVQICRTALDAGALPGCGGVKPHLTLLVDLPSLLRRTDTPHPARLAGSAPVALASVEALCCDATIRRLVLGPASEPLDIGRATRVVPAALRAALDVRDEHCQFPGCRRPARWCDAHHRLPWWRGGPTSLANLVLLCARHHAQVHRDDLHLRRAPDGRQWIEPFPDPAPAWARGP